MRSTIASATRTRRPAKMDNKHSQILDAHPDGGGVARCDPQILPVSRTLVAAIHVIITTVVVTRFMCGTPNRLPGDTAPESQCQPRREAQSARECEERP